MATKATVASACSAPSLPCAHPGTSAGVGLGVGWLRQAASRLAGGSWTEVWACHPQEKRNRTHFKGRRGKERDGGLHYWLLPRRSSGRTIQGNQGSLNGKWVEQKRIQGGFCILAAFRTHERGKLPPVYVRVLELHLTCEELRWSSSAGLETSAVWEQFRTPSSCEHTCGQWRFWREQLRACHKPQGGVRFFRARSVLLTWRCFFFFCSTLFSQPSSPKRELPQIKSPKMR